MVCEGVGVRFRGNTSYSTLGNSQKKSFNIEIDYTVEGLRLMGYKTLNLLDCHLDASFMREVLYSNTCRQQVHSAKANFVRLEINGQSWGVYANVQQLNAQFLNDWFLSSDGTFWRADGMMGAGGQTPAGGGGGGTTGGGGAVVRRTSDDSIITVAEQGGGVTTGTAALTWQGSTSATYQQAYELKNSKQADPWASLIHVCDVLNNTASAELPDKLESVLNVDRALWVCAFEIIFQDDDGYVNKRGSDYCLYYEPETGLMHMVQYDGNESMATGQWSIFYRSDDSTVPVMSRLMTIPKYRQRYLAHVRTILGSYFTEASLFPKIDAYKALIDAEVKADPKKRYTYEAFVSGVAGLESFLQSRRSYMLSDRQVSLASPKITGVDQKVVQGESSQTLTVTAHLSNAVAASAVQLFVAAGPLSLFSPVPMVDQGGASERTFAVTLPDYSAGTVLRYYVQATASDSVGTLAFDPPGAEHCVYTHVVTYPHGASSSIVINEIMARNQSTIADPQGQCDVRGFGCRPIHRPIPGWHGLHADTARCFRWVGQRGIGGFRGEFSGEPAVGQAIA